MPIHDCCGFAVFTRGADGKLRPVTLEQMQEIREEAESKYPLDLNPKLCEGVSIAFKMKSRDERRFRKAIKAALCGTRRKERLRKRHKERDRRRKLCASLRF